MCGIVGYIGERVTPLLIAGLKRLEYRGYDSAGVAVVNSERDPGAQGGGKIAELEKLLEEEPASGRLRDRAHPLGDARRAHAAQRAPARQRER
jgi:glutamine---fructose-6-phosphate transaminase (isomerizing)